MIVTLDGDGQNDPADGPKLVDALHGRAAGRWPWSAASGSSARTAPPRRSPRRSATGCASALLQRHRQRHRLRPEGLPARGVPAAALLRPHPPLPAGADAARGLQVAFRPVNHRHRQTGASKYTNLGRLWASLSDLFGRDLAAVARAQSRRPVEEAPLPTRYASGERIMPGPGPASPAPPPGPRPSARPGTAPWRRAGRPRSRSGGTCRSPRPDLEARRMVRQPLAVDGIGQPHRRIVTA